MLQRKIDIDGPPSSFTSSVGLSSSPVAAAGYKIGARLFDAAVIAILGTFFCIYNIGGGSFGNGDQTTHSLVVQHMVKFGDLLHPMYDGRLYFNKPPFKMWLATIPVALLGESNFSYRLIDGLSGVGIALAVFFFARALFSSRIIGFFSVFALLGSRVFYFGHGIRNAVQDGMMLFLMTLGTIVGWYFLERIKSSPQRSLWGMALLGGVLIGLAALTKNVAGYMAFIILGSHLIVSGDLVVVVKRAWKELLFTAAVSLGIPAAYILAQGTHRQSAFEMLVLTEVVKRATKGYHFVKHHWYYWNALVRDRIAVPPELLGLGVAFGSLKLVQQRDRRYLFIMCWAIVPVLVQSAMKSKLFWYILPALPGMSILVGALVGTAAIASLSWLGEWCSSFRTPPLRTFTLPAAALFATGILGVRLVSLGTEIAGPQKRNDADIIVADVLKRSATSGRELKTVFYRNPRLARHEEFYFNMIPTERLPDDAAALKQRLDTGGVDFVVTGLDGLIEVLRARPAYSYSVIPMRDKRRRWLAIVSYLPDYLPETFVRLDRRFRFDQNRDLLGIGFGPPSIFLGKRFIPATGEISSLNLPGGWLYSELGTDVTLHMASTFPQNALSIEVSMNGEKIAEINNISEGFHDERFTIPPGKWLEGVNTITFRYLTPSGSSPSHQQPALFETFNLAVSGVTAHPQ